MTRQSDSGRTTALHDDIRLRLRLADATSLAGSLGRFLMGIVVCAGMGAIVASLITAFVIAVFGHIGIGWSGWFLAYAVILVPVLIWHERRSREDYLTEALLSLDPNPSSHGQFDMNWNFFQLGMYSSLLVWGPRALIDGFRGMRGHRSRGQEAVFDRAALLVLDLAKADGSVAIQELLVPPENMQVFGAAVDLLDRHDCIGKSTDGRSLWLNSTYRQKLGRLRSKTRREGQG